MYFVCVVYILVILVVSSAPTNILRRNVTVNQLWVDDSFPHIGTCLSCAE